MKTKAFQTKRKPLKAVRTLYAKTKKKKQRVSAAASGGDFAVEEPNLGVARALVVILILHVAAIIAIVVHSSRNSDDTFIAKEGPEGATKNTRAAVAAHQPKKPKIKTNDRVGYVQQSDTYERFARRHGVDVQELRRCNGGVPLKYGMALILPELPVSMASVEPQDVLINESLPPISDIPEPVRVRQEIPADFKVVGAPTPIVSSSQEIPNPFPEPSAVTPLAPQPSVEIRETAAVAEIQPLPVPAQPEPEPVVREVAPPVLVEAPRPNPVVEEKPKAKPKPKLKTYTVKKGDTMWAISRRYGVSVDKIKAANRSVNPTAMGPGTRLNIPAK